jgi:BCD family chlorophyll transporter-like MFS transporter
MTTATPFGWLQIVRLGLIQACLGAVVVMTTSTLNRVMVVELALPALLPGFLVGLHYAVQIVRPRLGYGADRGKRCTPWMVGGMAVLAMGGCLAAMATAWMAQDRLQGIALAILAFMMIGLGVSACGTSLLVLMSKRVPDALRAPAATTVWMMMIMGFALTAVTAGKWLDPYSPERLVLVTSCVSLIAFLLSSLSVWRLEGRPVEVAAGEQSAQAAASPSQADFSKVLKEVWQEPQARRFTIFVFLSMLAYSAQDLILEPFAGAVLQMTPGETTQLSGLQHGAVLLGMLSVAVAGSGWARGRLGSVQSWMVGGCLVSGLAMGGLCLAGLHGAGWPLRANVWLLGVANGAFSIAAISTMMRLAREGTSGREGTRMGLWGAAQGIAFGLGGLVGTGATDLARHVIQQLDLAYASVFFFEMLLFVASAWWAVQVATPRARRASSNLSNASWASQGQQP